jgi:hypothetical protein
MKLFHAGLSVVGKTSERQESEQLRAARGARVEAQRALEAEQEKLERREAVTVRADELARVASNAAEQAKAARKAWAMNGCIDHARAHHELATAAAEAARAAKEAAQDADAVSREISLSRDAVRSRQSDLQEAERAILRVIADAFIEELMPVVERRAQLISQLQECEVEIRGLSDYLSDASHERLREIVARTKLVPIPHYEVAYPSGRLLTEPPPHVLALTAKWRQRAEALRGGT